MGNQEHKSEGMVQTNEGKVQTNEGNVHTKQGKVLRLAKEA